MSRKVLNKSFCYDEGDAAEVKVKKKIREEVPPGHVPWSNPNGLGAPNKKTRTTQGLVADDGVGIRSGTSGGRHLVASSRDHDTRPGAEALGRQGRHHPVLTEETRPGAILVRGIDNEGVYDDVGSTIEEEYDEQTIPPNDDSTLEVVARVVDTEEENRILRQQDQMRIAQDWMRFERDRAVHDRDQLLQMISNAVVVKPFAVADLDEESGNGEVDEESGNGEVVQGAARDADLPKRDNQNLVTRRRRCFAVVAILLVLVAVGVAVAVVILLNPHTPEPSTQAATNAAQYRVKWGTTYTGACSPLGPKVTLTCTRGAAIELTQEPVQTDCTVASASAIVCTYTNKVDYTAEFTCSNGAYLAASALLGGGECTTSEDASWAGDIQIFLLCKGVPHGVGTCYPQSLETSNICTGGDSCENYGGCNETSMTIPDITSIIDGVTCDTLD